MKIDWCSSSETRSEMSSFNNTTDKRFKYTNHPSEWNSMSKGEKDEWYRQNTDNKQRFLERERARQHSCDKCGVVFATKASRDRHCRDEVCTRPIIPCETCTLEFKCPKSYKIHQSGCLKMLEIYPRLRRIKEESSDAVGAVPTVATTEKE